MLFLVRWPELRASVVSARDEGDLINVLDQMGDPGGCTYQLYRGPVWVDFALPFEIRDITPEKPVATDVTDFTVAPTPDYEGPPAFESMSVELPPCDWGELMREHVMRGAFPHLYEWVEAEADKPGEYDREPFPEDLRAALVADLEPLVRHCQAQEALHGREDPEAVLMKTMDVTVVPPAWNSTANDAPDLARQELEESMSRFATALAAKLGVAPEAVRAALSAEDVHGCLDDLSDAWCLVADSEFADEDEDAA